MGSLWTKKYQNIYDPTRNSDPKDDQNPKGTPHNTSNTKSLCLKKTWAEWVNVLKRQLGFQLLLDLEVNSFKIQRCPASNIDYKANQ